MILQVLRDVLLTTLDNVYHNEALQADDSYVVFSETGENALKSDNMTSESSYVVAVDFFTKAEYDEIHKEIETALCAAEFAVSDVEIDYETDTQYYHYAWTVYL